jgi:hypothetical protein
MSEPLPSIDELLDAPELVILHALSTTLEAAERGLMASYPDLEFVAFSSSMPPSDISMCLAEAILNHVASLRIALERYRSHVLHVSDVRQSGPEL